MYVNGLDTWVLFGGLLRISYLSFFTSFGNLDFTPTSVPPGGKKTQTTLDLESEGELFWVSPDLDLRWIGFLSILFGIYMYQAT